MNLPLQFRALNKSRQVTNRLTVYVAGIANPDQMYDIERTDDGAFEITGDGPLEIELIASNKFRIRRCRT